MEPLELLREYLNQKHVMQLATIGSDSHLWACNVHYFSDDACNLYWVSSPKREHSRHIADNEQTAVAILVHENTEAEDYAIGVSMSGTAEKVDSPDPAILQGYASKHGSDTGFIDGLASGSIPVALYKFMPTKTVLIDSKNFPDNTRLEVELTEKTT